jgi:hypothetical protein
MSDTGVRWPGKGYDPEGTDLSQPMRQLLVDLNLLENPTPDDKAHWRFGTPRSLQVITSGASSISKLVVGAVGGVGGLSALATGLNGFFGKVGPNNLDTPMVRTAFIVAGALLGAAVAISLAIVVRADVSARAASTAAQFDARARVASALLRSYVAPAVAPPAETPYAVQTKDNSWHLVKEFRWQDGRAVAVVEGDITPSQEWAGLVSLSNLKDSST